jgi:hypothetical protein
MISCIINFLFSLKIPHLRAIILSMDSARKKARRGSGSLTHRMCRCEAACGLRYNSRASQK